MVRSLSVLCVLAAVLAAAVPAAARPGALDKTFGRGGVAVVDLGASASATELAPGPRGTLIVGGWGGGGLLLLGRRCLGRGVAQWKEEGAGG